MQVYTCAGVQVCKRAGMKTALQGQRILQGYLEGAAAGLAVSRVDVAARERCLELGFDL